ncbi:MAG: nucleotidyltransferase family protein, partial [bacterium]
LREWIIPLLTRSVSPDEAIATWPLVTSRAWALFLAAETVAWPLSQRLGAAVARLPDAPRAELDRAARLEVQRIMAARVELAVVDRVADGCDVDPVVLKGGVALADGSHGFDLGDLDLLLPADDLERLGHALVVEGFTFHPAMGGCYTNEGALPIELHDALEVGYDVPPATATTHVSFAQFRRLKRLSAPAHVLYMIQHSTTKHALRRGHLRDVLLIGSSLDGCTPAERDEIARAVQASPMRDVYEATLSLARATQGDAVRGAGPIVDAFRRVAAGKYATSVWFPRGSPSLLPLFLDQVPHFVASSSDARRLVLGYLGTDVPPGSRWYSSSLARVSAPLARALGAAVRTPYRLMALSVAGAVGSYIKWCYRWRWSDTSATR